MLGISVRGKRTSGIAPLRFWGCPCTACLDWPRSAPVPTVLPLLKSGQWLSWWNRFRGQYVTTTGTEAVLPDFILRFIHYTWFSLPTIAARKMLSSSELWNSCALQKQWRTKARAAGAGRMQRRTAWGQAVSRHPVHGKFSSNRTRMQPVSYYGCKWEVLNSIWDHTLPLPHSYYSLWCRCSESSSKRGLFKTLEQEKCGWHVLTPLQWVSGKR